MKITCISDLHGEYPETNGGDLLLLAGDYTGSDKTPQWDAFYKWLHKQDYRKKIMIAGNHDGFLRHAANSTDSRELINGLLDAGYTKEDIAPLSCEEDVEYLCDSGTEFEGLKIWGSPWSLWFSGINPHCKFFTGSEKDLEKKFSQIPTDTDILLTHTPPYGLADYFHEWGDSDRLHHAGSRSLAIHLEKMPSLKLHVFGHIHERHGRYDQEVRGYKRISLNASYMNASYNPTNPPIDLVL